MAETPHPQEERAMSSEVGMRMEGKDAGYVSVLPRPEMPVLVHLPGGGESLIGLAGQHEPSGRSRETGSCAVAGAGHGIRTHMRLFASAQYQCAASTSFRQPRTAHWNPLNMPPRLPNGKRGETGTPVEA